MEGFEIAEDSAIIEIDDVPGQSLTWRDVEDALWCAILQAWRPDAAFDPPLPDKLEDTARSGAALPPSVRGASLLKQLSGSLGDDWAIVLRSHRVSCESADATSRVLERLADIIDRPVIWCVPKTHWNKEGIVRILSRDAVPLEDIEDIDISQDDDEIIDNPEITHRARLTPRKLRVRFGPIEGRPHPGSPAELTLAAALESTADLARCFLYNHRVRTVFQSEPVVDLVHSIRPLCVEVDSYRFHTGRAAFARDRQRDFELMATGRVVLRLTHGEITRDVGAAIEKIRAILRTMESLDV